MTPDLSAVPWIPEYRLKLDVDFAGLTWTGTVEFDLPAGPNDLVLDSDGLEVTAVRKNGGTAPFLVRTDACELVLSGPHPAPVTIAIDFSGRVAEDALIGLYRSRNGSAQVLTSQCEPVGARKIFPCLDRPDRKARIRLTVSVDADLEVVANTPAEAVTEGGARREWTFPATPPMATYLFYLGIGRFGHWEDRSGRVPVRVFTPVGRDAAGEFAAKAAARILAGYERYYGIPYPLPKLDLIAVAEHAFGAMENWGAISFNEIRLLIDTTSASFQRRDVFETISHEIAHQWFGDLVTMRWWDDVWLNESFASFLETKVTDEIDPSLDAPTDFVLRTAGMAAALDGDSLGVTHPVRAKVARPEEISQVFDEISYGKGSSVLRMLETYLGEEVFRRGVGEYLERFRYGNARTEDLWEALERAAAVPVSPIVGPWIDRPGLPLVSARLGPSGLELAQARFAYAGTVEEPPWPIPMTFERDGRRDRLLFDSRTRTLPCPPGATVHLNPGALGFYRTLYDADLFDRLLAALPSRPPSDRWIVLNDLAAFVLSGQADWPTYARAVRALGTTSDRLVVEEIVGSLAGWALAFPSVATVQDLARSYLAELVERVGLDRPPAETPATGILRERASYARAQVDAGFARDLSERFVGWARLDPDLRSAVAIARSRTEGEVGRREILTALGARPPEADALRLERALAWSGEPALVAETLSSSLSKGFNRGHITSVVVQAAANPVGRPLVLPWLEEHLPELSATFRGSGFLSLLLEHSVPFAGLGRVDEARRFFADHPYPEGTRGLAKGLERLDLLEALGRRLTR